MLPVFFVAYLQASNNVKAMQSFREKLPAFKMKAEFLKAVAENQVLLCYIKNLFLLFIVDYDFKKFLFLQIHFR